MVRSLDSSATTIRIDPPNRGAYKGVFPIRRFCSVVIDELRKKTVRVEYEGAIWLLLDLMESQLPPELALVSTPWRDCRSRR